MKKTFDILLDDDFDLQIKDGDLVIGDASSQNVKMLLLASQGEYKDHPEVGIGIEKSKNGAITRFMERDIRIQLENDGFDLEELTINEKGIGVKGSYE